MNNEKNEFNVLLRQFMDETHVRQALQDFDVADQIFDAYPVPAVQRKTILSIQGNLRREFDRGSHYYTPLWRTIGFAATIAAALLAGLYMLYLSDGKTRPTMSASFASAIDWNNVLYADDSSLTQIENELTDVAQSMQNLSVDPFKPVNTLSQDMMELDEIESLVNSTEFWKG